MRSSGIEKQASRSIRPAGATSALVCLLSLASCATEPPPRPVRLDPANPAAAESKPLDTTVVQMPPPPAEPASAPPAVPNAPAAEEHGGSHEHDHGHEHGHGDGGSQ
jgi:hypothetical protein